MTKEAGFAWCKHVKLRNSKMTKPIDTMHHLYISRFDTKNVNIFFSFFIQYDLLEYFSSNYVKYFFQSNKKLFYWILYHILIFWKSNMTLHYMMQTLHLKVLINFSFNFQCLSDKSKYFLFIFMFNEFMIGTLPKNLHRRK